MWLLLPHLSHVSTEKFQTRPIWFSVTVLSVPVCTNRHFRHHMVTENNQTDLILNNSARPFFQYKPSSSVAKLHVTNLLNLVGSMWTSQNPTYMFNAPLPLRNVLIYLSLSQLILNTCSLLYIAPNFFRHLRSPFERTIMCTSCHGWWPFMLRKAAWRFFNTLSRCYSPTCLNS